MWNFITLGLGFTLVFLIPLVIGLRCDRLTGLHNFVVIRVYFSNYTSFKDFFQQLDFPKPLNFHSG